MSPSGADDHRISVQVMNQNLLTSVTTLMSLPKRSHPSQGNGPAESRILLVRGFSQEEGREGGAELPPLTVARGPKCRQTENQDRNQGRGYCRFTACRCAVVHGGTCMRSDIVEVGSEQSSAQTLSVAAAKCGPATMVVLAFCLFVLRDLFSRPILHL